MSLINPSQLRNVSGISDTEKKAITNFLQGAVYCWCKNKKEEWFSIRDLMGGDNYYWEGTPLLPLYTKHENQGKSWQDSVKDAGKDCGWLLKNVIADDKRTFETKKEDLVRKYRWVGNEK